tara:strand:+ start:371 stop:649 length:279 start_codon:yes stop_codon:yes gene_type:complete
MTPRVFQNANASVVTEFQQTGNNALLLVHLNAAPVLVPSNCPQRTRVFLTNNLPILVDKKLPNVFVKTAHQQATVAPKIHEKNVRTAKTILH